MSKIKETDEIRQARETLREFERALVMEHLRNNEFEVDFTFSEYKKGKYVQTSCKVRLDPDGTWEFVGL